MKGNRNNREWGREVIYRQRNITPQEIIHNSVLLEGNLYKGKLALNFVQRVGALILGLS